MGRGIQHGMLVIAHQAQRTGVDQTGQAFAALGAGDVAVAVGHDHGVHDLLFGHLHHLEGLFAALFDELLGQALHAREGDRVADHGGLGHAGGDGHGLPHAGVLGRGIVAVHGVGVFALHAEDARQAGDDAQFQHLEEAGHDGRDVARVADGHEDAQAGHVPAVPLGHFIGVGFLAQDAPAVLGVEQGHAVILGQMLHHLHAVVEHAGQFQHRGTAAQGLGELLRGHFAVGQQHHALEGRAHIGGVQGRGGGGITGGGADGQHLVPLVAAAEPFQIAERTGHAAVLEGGAGVLAVVLVGKGHAHTVAQGRSGFHDGGQAFAQIDDVFLVQQGRQQLVITEDAAQGRAAGRGAAVEDLAPFRTAVLFQFVELGVFQQEHAAAGRAGVEQAVTGVTLAAVQAHIFHLTAIGGKITLAHGIISLQGQDEERIFLPSSPVTCREGRQGRGRRRWSFSGGGRPAWHDGRASLPVPRQEGQKSLAGMENGNGGAPQEPLR